MYTDVSSNNDVKIPQRPKDTICVTATAIAFVVEYRVITSSRFMNTVYVLL